MENINSAGEHGFESSAEGLADKVETLFCQQLDAWELAKKNYQSLRQVEMRRICFPEMEYQIQFNPSRLVSAQAKVDTKSIRERSCFLCQEHLPQEQKGIYVGKGIYGLKQDYQLLINPFPIFRKHLTIPSVAHVKQSIEGRIGDMLDLARQLPAFTLFYNGPECGASAPDHMHFQAGCKDEMPFERAWRGMNKRILCQKKDTSLYAINETINHVLVFKGNDKDWITDRFEQMLKLALDSPVSVGKSEPMMNLLCEYTDSEWILSVFLRQRHRPMQYFEEGDNNRMISPGAVDLGGIIITPLKKDFSHTDKIQLEDILYQVIIDVSEFNELTTKLRQTDYE
ncbi:MAG: DUF4922 domain-containing protein [Bacteroidales bacterium]